MKEPTKENQEIELYYVYRCPVCKVDYNDVEEAEICYRQCGEEKIVKEYGRVKCYEQHFIGAHLLKEDDC